MQRRPTKVYKRGYSLTGEPLLHHKIKVFKKVLSVNVLGESYEDYELYKTVYSLIIPQTGAIIQNKRADTILAKTTHKFIVRFDENIKSDSYIISDGIKYDIDYALDPYNEHKYLEIFARVVI